MNRVWEDAIYGPKGNIFTDCARRYLRRSESGHWGVEQISRSKSKGGVSWQSMTIFTLLGSFRIWIVGVIQSCEITTSFELGPVLTVGRPGVSTMEVLNKTDMLAYCESSYPI